VITTEMAKVCPGIETAVVKRALSRTGAAVIPPPRAHALIESAAARAVERLAVGEMRLIEFRPRFEFEIDLRQPITPEARAVIGERFPEFTVSGERTIAFAHEEMAVAYRMAAITQFLAKDPTAVRGY
jgi:D-aminopeptidase